MVARTKLIPGLQQEISKISLKCQKVVPQSKEVLKKQNKAKITQLTMVGVGWRWRGGVYKRDRVGN